MFEDYIGRVSFEKTRKIQLENKSEDYGEEPEYEIVDEIEDVEDCEDEEESVSRRIVIVEELKEKEHQEQEAEERREQEAKERREQEVKERRAAGGRTTRTGGNRTSGTGGERTRPNSERTAGNICI
jgi:TolA-binding protein